MELHIKTRAILTWRFDPLFGIDLPQVSVQPMAMAAV